MLAPAKPSFVGDSITKGRKKVPLPPGHSQLDWMRLCNTSSNLSGVPKVAHYTYAEVRKHCSKDDAWMVVNDKIYNITPYMSFHPGSIEELMRGVGKDATILFNEIHPWVNISSMLEKCLVGTIKHEHPQINPTVALSCDVFRDFEIEEIFSVSPNESTKTFRLAFPEGATTTGFESCNRHVVLRALVDSKVVLREYTPTSSPHADKLDLTVKLYPDGKMSQFLLSRSVGDKLALSGPFGPLTYRGDRFLKIGGSGNLVKVDHYAMICAGSGVTPMYQTINCVLGMHDTPEQSSVSPPELTLVVLDKTPDDAILPQELTNLAAANKIVLHWVFSKKDAQLESADWAIPPTNIRNGRLSLELIQECLPPPAPTTTVLVCGPPLFNIKAIKFLTDLGHAAESIHEI